MGPTSYNGKQLNPLSDGMIWSLSIEKITQVALQIREVGSEYWGQTEM